MRKSALIVPKVSNRLVAEQNTSFFVFCIDATPPLSPFTAALGRKECNHVHGRDVYALGQAPGVRDERFGGRLKLVQERDAY
jgi:hypothetical protein